MTLRKAQPTERCDFPTWFKGPKHWHALMGNAGYVFHPSDGSMHILKQSGYMETRALCEQINKQTEDEMQAVVHYTTGCKSGFMCMIFYRRDTYVAEIQMGKPASRVEDACALDHFDTSKISHVTLLATNASPDKCLMDGSYRIRGRIGPPYMSSRHKRGHAHHHHDTYHRRHGTLSFRNSEESEQLWQSAGRSLSPRHRRAISQEIEIVEDPVGTGTDIEVRSKRDSPGCTINYNSNRRLRIGCTRHDVIDMTPSCSDEGDEEYLCHGQWQENSTTFIVAKHVGSSHGVCITFKQNPDGATGNLIVGDSCFRSNPNQLTPSDRHLVSNITSFSTCSDTSSSIATQINVFSIVFCVLLSSFFASR
uniref:CSON009864 protein n=2 Tax=Culicoides sonorensis TaxID=179676 RepID=A0A336N2X1_CULSO